MVICIVTRSPVLGPDEFLVPNLIGHIRADVQTAPEYAQHHEHFNFQGLSSFDEVPSSEWGKIASMMPGPNTGPYPKGTRVACDYYVPSGHGTGSSQ